MRRPLPDWPGTGPIDLALHDLPHRSSTTEWWYVNAHLGLEGGRSVSLFAAFFRVRTGRDPATGETHYAHSATWALTDADGKTYLPDSRVDPTAPKMGLERIKQGRASKDARLNRALTEVLERGHVPAPDRVFDSPVRVGLDKLDLDFGGLRFSKEADGRYRLALDNPRARVACDLTFAPRKSPVRHGDDGLVQGPGGEDMFYYFIPRCEVSGSVGIGNAALPVVAGSGWYDHEFGGPPDSKDGVFEFNDQVAWNWIAAQLDDGSEVTAYALVRCDDGKVLNTMAVVVDRDGLRSAHADVEIAPLK
ncbi:MAG: lipocalin-like domain-containing protein, partial [Myxococcales bacterium]